MKAMSLASPGERLSVLCLGAHSDDIEIGVGGTVLTLMSKGVQLDVHWCVLSAVGERALEARNSAQSFLSMASSRAIALGEFEDSMFPSQSREIKAWLLGIRDLVDPDVIFTHSRDDQHQDHSEVSRLTSNVFRNHLILEYEIPKWDGDLCRRNSYVALGEDILHQKVTHLLDHFATQRSKDWFDADTFTGLARLRGVECRAPERFAEAFTIRKLSLA
jgi:LmbE family N-acetylglucosaminyl deacetylase